MSLVYDLSEKLVELNKDNVPGEVLEKAKTHYVDFLAALMLAQVDSSFKEIGKTYTRNILLGKPVSFIDEAFYLSMQGNFSNFEDGNRMAGGHPSVVVMPAAIALAKKNNSLSTKQFLIGVVAGYEVFCRIAEAMNPSHLRRGFHTTATVGSLAAAATAAKILALNVEETATALSLAAIRGAGLMESFSSDLRYFQVAKSCEDGVFAALMAQNALISRSEYILEGKQGYFNALSDQWMPDPILKNFGEKFKINSCYLKIHAGCRHIHPAIDAVLNIVNQNGLDFREIEKINIETYLVAVRDFEIEDPKNAKEAEFCISFGVAVSLIKGNAYPWQFCENNLRDTEIQQFMKKITIKENNLFSEQYPQKRMAGARIVTRDGKVYSYILNYAYGEPENPLPDTVFKKKIRTIVGSWLQNAEKINNFISEGNRLLSIEKIADFNHWVPNITEVKVKEK